MKKWLCVILVGVLLCSLTACKDVPANPTDDGAENSTTTVTTPSSYTAADLYFPVHNATLKAPDKAVMKEVSIGFDWAQKRVRMQLPETMTVNLVEQGSRSYAAIYCGDLRIGRLVPNFVFPDTISGEIESEIDVAGYTVNHFSYTAGKQVAYTYSALMMPDDAFFYVLEISADYISASDLVSCLQSLQSIQLLERNNRLESRGKDNLRIAIAGNSFVGYSNVVQQLQAILDANGKNVDVDEHWFPNITITDFAHDADKLDMLCGATTICFSSTAPIRERMPTTCLFWKKFVSPPAPSWCCSPPTTKHRKARYWPIATPP